jgi:heme-degrading monooxygenase HmoA
MGRNRTATCSAACTHIRPLNPKPPRLAEVIARIWRGWIRRADSDAYLDYLRETGLDEYRATPGNRGAWVLRRDDGERTEVITLSFWDSLDAIHGFAGDDIARAVFYPEDDRFLVDRELTVRHYQLDE